MTAYEEKSLWDLAYSLDPTNVDLCKGIDKHLADKIETVDDLMEIRYYLCYGDTYNFLSHTKNKINNIFRDEINKDEIKWWQFESFTKWFDDKTKPLLAKKWLESDNDDADISWATGFVNDEDETNLKVLGKLVKLYKKKKRSEIVYMIDNIFVNMPSSSIDSACQLISKSTPAVSVTLLRRNDVPEKYTLKGLKSLSKLSKQRDLKFEINFDTLSNLGPKARLDAMKQLLGMYDKYYQFKKNNDPNKYGYGYTYRERRLKASAKEYSLPFKEIPKREDVEKFLFPCSLKYNDEVVSMIERFDELVSQKEEEDGKRI